MLSHLDGHFIESILEVFRSHVNMKGKLVQVSFQITGVCRSWEVLESFLQSEHLTSLWVAETCVFSMADLKMYNNQQQSATHCIMG